jgi:hypothetical protein
MVAYSFKRQFADPIRTRRKTQTIRAERKRHARVGETLQLYTGMRTKQCMLIGTAVCASLNPITMDLGKAVIFIAGQEPIGRRFRLDEFARGDGFEDWEGLRAFWKENHAAIERWSGVIITWRDFKAPPR